MQLPTLKSVTDIRREAKKIFDQVRKHDDVVIVTKNNSKVSVIISPEHFESLTRENESLWEELEMARSKKMTTREKAYPLSDVISGKV